MDEERKVILKVCFIQTDAYHLFNKKSNLVHGGSELQLYFIANELSLDNRFEITFIVGDFKQKKVEKYNNVTVYKAFNPKSNDNILKKIIQAVRYYFLFNQINADIYFTSAANSTVGLVSFFCRKKKKKHIHRTASSVDVDDTFVKSNGVLGKIYRYGIKRSDLVITQTSLHKKLLNDNYEVDARVIKNIFHIESVSPLNKGEHIVLWVSRYDKMKNPELFLDLAKIFYTENFVIICPCSDECNRKYLELIQAANNIKNLSFIKRVEFRKIQAYFNEAKVFVNTSDYEGFPNTFVQAGIGKTPILSLNVNPDNFLDDYNCGYCCNGDFDDMKNKLESLLSNKSIWKEKSKNVFNYVKENHFIEKNITTLKTILFDLN